MNVSLTAYLDEFVGDQVKSGRYRTASEVVREGLRLLELRESQIDQVQSALDEGRASVLSDGKEAMDRVRYNLKQKHGV